MTIIAPTPIPGAPTVPSSGDPETTFDAQYEAFNSYEKNILVPQLNVQLDVVYQNALDAKNSADASTGAIAAAAAAAASQTAAAASQAAAAASATTASTKAGEASASATGAAGSASMANTKAGEASTSAASALASRNQAEVFATQQLKATSTTSLTPGAGNKVFTIETSRSFVPGMYLVATSAGASSNTMRGTVVSYDGGTGALTLNVDQYAGASARADWVIGVAAQGATDPASAIHAAASKTTPVDADELGLVDSAASWGLKKLTWANLKATLFAYLQGLFREKLTAARTYYVRTDGNDANNGLTNTAGGAFATIQKAIDMFAPLDLNGQTATIQVGDGTWSAGGIISATLNGTLTITGNATTPDNVLVSQSSGSCFTASGTGVRVAVRNMKIQAAAVTSIYATSGAQITAGNCTLGACGFAHLAADRRGFILVDGNCRIVGNAPAWANLNNGFLEASLANITLTGTPAFTAFVYVYAMSYARIVLATFTGSATGKRYQVESNSYTNVNAAGANYLPGNAAGTTATGGQYV